MPVWLLAALLIQEPSKPPAPTPKKPEVVVVDPNAPKGLGEDDPDRPKEYAYNPYEAEKEVGVGNYYMKKGSYTAAVKRYQEALKWKPNWALPYLKMGQAFEKKDDPVHAAEAFRKYLELTPNAKNAKDLRKQIARLEREAEK